MTGRPVRDVGSQDESWRAAQAPEERKRVRSAAIFRGVPREVLAQALHGALVRSHRRLEVLHEEGDPAECCAVVLSGRVRVFRVASDGRKLVIAHVLAGGVYGEWGLYGHATQRDSAQVAEDVRVVAFSVGALAPLFRTDPRLVRALAVHAADRRLDAESRIVAMLYTVVRSRLAAFLLDAARRDGVAEARGTAIRSRYSHFEIACTVGATRETITLALSEMRRRGLLVIERRRLIVRDLPKLRSLV